MLSFRLLLLSTCSLFVISSVDAQGTEHESRKYRAVFDLLTNVNNNVNELLTKFNALNATAIKEDIKRELLLTTKHVRLDEAEWKTGGTKESFQAQCSCQFREKDPTTRKLSSPIDAYGWPQGVPAHTWTLNNFQFKSGSVHEFPTILLAEHKLHVQLSLTLIDPTYARIGYRFTKAHDFTNQTSLLPLLVLILKDESGNAERKDTPRPLFHSHYGTSLEYNTWIQGPFLQVASPFTTYAKTNGSLVFELHVEPSEVTNSAASSNGVLNGSIVNFNQLYKWSQPQLIATPTPYFYSAPLGYRALALYSFYPSNNTDGAWLAFNLVLLHGKNDKLLSKPTLVKFTVTLFNQVDSKGHLVETLESSEIVAHPIEFKAPPVIEQFVVDDALNYKLEIQILK